MLGKIKQDWNDPSTTIWMVKETCGLLICVGIVALILWLP